MAPNKIFHFAYQAEDAPVLLGLNVEADNLANASAKFEKLKPGVKLVYVAPLVEAYTTADFEYTKSKIIDQGLTKKSITLSYQRQEVGSEAQNMKCVVAAEQVERFCEENSGKFVQLIEQ
jgi:hypothetical protein